MTTPNYARQVDNARQDIMAVASLLQNNPAVFVEAFAADKDVRDEFMSLASDLFSLAETIIGDAYRKSQAAKGGK